MAIAVIGAGMAGLAAATALTRGGEDVRLFDKGRGPGGRMATRRVKLGEAEIAFDHGAQYFTARSPEFRDVVDSWMRAGTAAEWGEGRYVGTPAMNSVIRAMAAPLEVTWGAQVGAIEGAPGAWRLRMEDGSVRFFDEAGRQVYADGSHLSAYGAGMLGGGFREAMAGVGR